MRVSADIDLVVALQPCPLCGGLDFEPLAQQDRHLLGLSTVGCRHCGLIQTNPRPDAAGLADFYALHYRRLYQGVGAPSEQYVAQYRKDVRLRYTVQHLARVLGLGEHSRLLDYGCGEGSLFAALRASGFRGQLAGVEPNAQFARYAADTSQADVRPTIDGFEQLDAVVVNHALEHLADPVGVLGDIRNRIKPGGWLYVDVPDADRYAHVGDLHLAHILHFSLRTLTATAQAAGFEVVSCEPHDPPHHPLSLRLLARPAADGAAPAPAYSPATEAPTWRRLRAMHARRWRWTLSRHLARVRPLRAAYAAWRRWSQPPLPPSDHA
jgi:SAM-dependent methyltransferase